MLHQVWDEADADDHVRDEGEHLEEGVTWQLSLELCRCVCHDTVLTYFLGDMPACSCPSNLLTAVAGSTVLFTLSTFFIFFVMT